MTDDDLAKIEAALKVRLPSECRQILSARSTELRELMIYYPWGPEPLFSDRFFLDADRLIDTNLIERQPESGTGAAFPAWEKQFVLIGADGDGSYYCMRRDNKPGVFMIGSDCGDTPELKAPSLRDYVDDVLVEYPAMSRRYPAPGRSSFDGSCEPHERMAIFLDSQQFEGNGRIVYQGDDGQLTLDDLAAAGVDRAGIHNNVIKVMAALVQSSPAEIAVHSYTQEGDPALRLDITGLPNQLNDRPYWFSAVQIYGTTAEIVFYGFASDVPSKISCDWRSLTSPLAGLIKAAFPGAVRIARSQTKPPMLRKDRLIYSLSFDLLV